MGHRATAWRTTLVLVAATQLAAQLVFAGEPTSPGAGSRHAPDPRNDELLAACGTGKQALHEVARAVVARSLRGEPPWSMVELGEHVRARGEPYPIARAWTLRGSQIDRAVAVERLRAWLASHDEGVPLRCGVASVVDSELGEAVAVVAVPVLADLAVAIPRTVSQGRWVTVDAVVRVPVTSGKIVVLRPRGVPRGIPTAFDASAQRVSGRFMADHEGIWSVQVVATTASGPKPVIEVEFRVGDGKAKPSGSAPGEDAGQELPDDQAMVAMINAARASEGLRWLVRDAVADEVAREHVRGMMAAGIVGHDVGKGSPPERASKAGLTSQEVGENVSRASSVTLVHRALWKSPSHRANTLHSRYERVGVGAMRDARGVVWVAVLFVGR